MVDSVQSALQNRPDAFDAVFADSITRILSCPMIHRFVHVVVAKPLIAGVLIGVEFRTAFDVRVNGLVQSDSVYTCKRHSLGATPALTHPDNRRLANRSPSEMLLFTFVLVFLFAPDVGLVNLHNAAQNG